VLKREENVDLDPAESLPKERESGNLAVLIYMTAYIRHYRSWRLSEKIQNDK
jgi:hypothetical protein